MIVLVPSQETDREEEDVDTLLFLGGLCVAKNRKEALFELLFVEGRLQQDGCRVGNEAAGFVIGSNLKREFLFKVGRQKAKGAIGADQGVKEAVRLGANDRQ